MGSVEKSFLEGEDSGTLLIALGFAYKCGQKLSHALIVSYRVVGLVVLHPNKLDVQLPETP